jgi:hypothetical protein
MLQASNANAGATIRGIDGSGEGIEADPARERRQHDVGFSCMGQLVVFSLKSFVQDLLSSWIERFCTALIAGTHQDRDPAVDVPFIAPLPKCHFFHALGNTPLFADCTHNRFVSGGHRPSSPRRRPDHSIWVTALRKCVSYFTLRENFACGRSLLLAEADSVHQQGRLAP